jgi:hypothetical protein
MLDLATRPPPEQAKATEAPPVPQRNNPHDDENWLFAAGLLGALAGAATRNHASNALAAFSGALQGYQEGSKQKFDQNMQIWEAENKKAIEANTAEQHRIDNILKNNKMSIEQMSVALQVVGQEFEDKGLITAARTKNELTIAQYRDQNARAMEQYQGTFDRLSEQRERADRRDQQFKEERWKAAADAYVASPAGKARIQSIVEGKQDPPPANPRTGELGYQDRAIKDALSQAGFDFRESDRDKAVKKIEATAPAMVNRAGESAYARTAGVAGANIELALRSAGPVITMAGIAAQGVPATGFPRINSGIQLAAEELGDPAIADFKRANTELINLMARAMNPRSNQITNAARTQAEDLIHTWDSPESYTRGLRQFKQFIEREFEVVGQQRRNEPIAPIEVPSGERKLQPTPRQFLPKGAGTVPGTDVEPRPGMRSIFGDAP